MYIAIDTPYFYAHEATAKNQLLLISKKTNTITEDCREVGNSEQFTDSAYNQFELGSIVFEFLGFKLDPNTMKFNVPLKISNSLKSAIISKPKHGSVYQTNTGDKNLVYTYKAEIDYQGLDGFILAVDLIKSNGQPTHIEVKFNLSVVDQITNENEISTCQKKHFL